MKVEEIQNILIIGAGTMGHQIGFLCATHGYDVTVYDIDPEFLKKAEERTVALSERFVRKWMLSSEVAGKAFSGISFTNDPEAAGRNADLLSESVPEDPALKGRIFAQFNEICPERTLFTTNTSSLVPSMFAEASGRPDRFLAFHFHDVVLTNVTDIMPHPGTSPEVVKTVQAFAEKIGQIAIVLKKEHPGYLFNSMFMTLSGTALNLAANEVASLEDIDRAWMGIMHTESGPFGIMDSVGLDTVWKITNYWAEKRNDPAARKNAEFVKTYLDKGCLGKKSGQGFYAYPNPAFNAQEFLAGTGAA